MIDGLDLVIRQTLTAAIPALAGRVGFQPPDDAWRQRVSAGTGIWLNCALVDLREDRARRTNEVRIEHDPPRRLLAPFRLRCHYLLSAWNSAKDSEAVPASMQEHGMLGRVVAALLEAAPLAPARVLPPADVATLPSAWREASFVTDILPPEGFGKIPEYWGTMGRNVPWRPVAWLAVTVPVMPEPIDIDGVVLTLLTSLEDRTPGADVETLVMIGGRVADAADVPIGDAVVTLTDAAGHVRARARSADDGRFRLEGIAPGDYLATAVAASHPPTAPVAVTIPAVAGGQLTLTLT